LHDDHRTLRHRIAENQGSIYASVFAGPVRYGHLILKGEDGSLSVFVVRLSFVVKTLPWAGKSFYYYFPRVKTLGYIDVAPLGLVLPTQTVTEP